MTSDLATRIADVKKKAQAAIEADSAFDAEAVNGPEVSQDVVFRMQAARIAVRNAASPDLFLAMVSEIEALTAKLEKAREALIAEREENLWHAYNEGHEKDGRWQDCCMSDAEWLVREIGFDPDAPDYDAALVRAAIPLAADRVSEKLKDKP